MFDFKTPQFFRSENRASQKQLAAALRESVTKVRHASSFGEVVDAVLDIPGEHVDHKLLQLQWERERLCRGVAPGWRWGLLPGN